MLRICDVELIADHLRKSRQRRRNQCHQIRHVVEVFDEINVGVECRRRPKRCVDRTRIRFRDADNLCKSPEIPNWLMPVDMSSARLDFTVITKLRMQSRSVRACGTKLWRDNGSHRTGHGGGPTPATEPSSAKNHRGQRCVSGANCCSMIIFAISGITLACSGVRMLCTISRCAQKRR